ncbi:MAG: hypothetical protein NTW87_28495 [Planctomycetota bacterium]|nr:hypothetical protein [Planctomycetota bacterium]
MVALWIALGALLLAAGMGDCVAADAGAGPRTFHVDATRGDDARDGLTPETAWRSLGMVNRAPLRPGDKVLFRRGEVWRGQLVPRNGDATGVVFYGAFGEGAKPLLLGSVAMNRPEDWQPAGADLWATAPLRFEPGAVQADLQQGKWWLYHEGGAACSLSPIPPDGEGHPGYRLECKQSGTEAHHIQLSVPGLSVRDGQYYLLTLRARCTQAMTLRRVALMKESAPWTGYAASDAALAIGTEWGEHTVRFHASQTAKDARLTLFLGGALPAGATLLLQPGKLVEAKCSQPMPLSADVGNIVFDQGKATGLKKWSVADLRQDGDYFYDARAWQVTLRSNANPATLYRSIELALSRHIIDQSARGYVTYEDLALSCGAAHGIGGGGTHHIAVRNCDISYIGGGHQFTPPGGKPVRYGNGVEFWSGARECLVEGCRLWEIYDAALTNQGDGVNVQENITYRRNVIWNSEYSFEFWNRGPTSRTRNIRFEHNTCVNAGHGWGYRQRPDPNGRHLMFYDNSSATEGVFVRYNIFCNAKDSCLRLSGRDWTSALTMDYNCWFQSQGPLLLWGKETVPADKFAAFQQARGFDAHSIVADPKFAGPARNDYRLAPDSPARALSDQGAPAGALP